jgi:hypothetical protein
VPALFALVYSTGYRLGYFPSETYDFGVLGFCVLLGLIAVNFALIAKGWVRFAASALYVLAMVPGLFFVGLWVACSNGNCV